MIRVHFLKNTAPRDLRWDLSGSPSPSTPDRVQEVWNAHHYEVACSLETSSPDEAFALTQNAFDSWSSRIPAETSFPRSCSTGDLVEVIPDQGGNSRFLLVAPVGFVEVRVLPVLEQNDLGD